jgi:hypothetical protein
MQAFGMLLLAAATAGDGFGYSDPGVGLKKWLRPHAVVSAGAPGPPTYTANGMGGQGGPMGAAPGRRFVNTRSQVYFLDPDGMQVGWQTSAGPNGERAYLPAQLTVPARYNFNQGYIYRLKLTSIPGRAGAALYPTIEVAPTTPATDAYLAHNAIPIQFTDEDFQQVLDGGNFVTKVIYLPDPRFQELAVSGVETLVSTRLEPGIDPILEADKRGTILLIVRLGAIDLEMPGGGNVLGGAGAPPAAGAVVTPPGTVATSPAPAGTVELPPGAQPPGVNPTAPPAPGTVVLDPPPAGAAPAVAPQPPPAPAPGTPATSPKPGPSASAEPPAEPAVASLAPAPEPPAVVAPAPEPPAEAAPPAAPRP